jgi:hypothetical protein
MGKGKFNTSVVFDLSDSLGKYTMIGRLDNMDLTTLNEFMENSVSVQIKSGTNKTMNWNYTADLNIAKGQMDFFYTDLKLNILRKDTLLDETSNKAFLTFFANTFVVSQKNPQLFVTKTGDIFLVRDEKRDIFNYWGKALLSGVISSVGAKNNKKVEKKYNKSLMSTSFEN